MNTMASENMFLSTLQPGTSSTSYALPSDGELGEVRQFADDRARSRRVQAQVRLRIAEKSTLPRQNGSSSQYAMSDYGGSSTMKYSTYAPNFSSRSSYMYTGSKMSGPQASQRRDYSSRSAADLTSQFQRMSTGGGSRAFHQEDLKLGRFMRQPSRLEHDTMSVHSMRNYAGGNAWMMDGSDGGSMVSEQDATITYPIHQSGLNGLSTQMSQKRSTTSYQTKTPETMIRTLSGNIAPSGYKTAEMIYQQHSFKGPAHRTINRITNRNRMGSMYGTQMTSSSSNFGGGDTTDLASANNLASASQTTIVMPNRKLLSRSASIKSMQSVGRGEDVFLGQMENGSFSGNGQDWSMDIEMERVLDWLYQEDDPQIMAKAAAYIQHLCFSNELAKDELREKHGIERLKSLFQSEDKELVRYVTGAMRNAVYKNKENKKALLDGSGLQQLLKTLEHNDEEILKNVTGICWNLSSHDVYKDVVAKHVLSKLTEAVLKPVAEKIVEKNPDTGCEKMSASLEEAFLNTTGSLRNMSSARSQTRTSIRETPGLVGSLVTFLKASLNDSELCQKGMENVLCVLRNLSYHLYEEMSPKDLAPLTKEEREDNAETGSNVGCFTPNSQKAKNKKMQCAMNFTEISKNPVDIECLYHTSTLALYHEVLKDPENNILCIESAIGALQNVMTGDILFTSKLANWATEHNRLVPTLTNYVNSERMHTVLPLSGLLRNLIESSPNKDKMAKDLIPHLIHLLQKQDETKPYDIGINILGALNNLVTHSYNAARDLWYFKGIRTLIDIKAAGNQSPEKLKLSRGAATVLSNVYRYKKLRKNLLHKGVFKKSDFSVLPS